MALCKILSKCYSQSLTLIVKQNNIDGAGSVLTLFFEILPAPHNNKVELFKKLKQIDDYLLFYVTPEVIMDDKLIIIFKDLYKDGKLARMVIDEAHCVSTWGHDFRDSYLKLKLIKKYIPDNEKLKPPKPHLRRPGQSNHKNALIYLLLPRQ